MRKKVFFTMFIMILISSLSIVLSNQQHVQCLQVGSRHRRPHRRQAEEEALPQGAREGAACLVLGRARVRLQERPGSRSTP